jgi:hypothetical protein
MIYIAHRGNLYGPNHKRENAPDYIMEALGAGFHVELDLWVLPDGKLMLGHDGPQYEIEADFLKNYKFWVHCKNLAALVLCRKLKTVRLFCT